MIAFAVVYLGQKPFSSKFAISRVSINVQINPHTLHSAIKKTNNSKINNKPKRMKYILK